MKNPLYSYCFTIYIILVITRGLTNASGKVKKNIDDEDVTDEGKDLENMEIPAETEIKNSSCARRSGSRMHEIKQARDTQFPFVAALLSTTFEYVCAGTLVTDCAILTSYDCASHASYALLNTTIAKKDNFEDLLSIVRTERFPTNDKDVAVVYTKPGSCNNMSPVSISNFTRPEDIIDIEAVGFGLNAEVGEPKELQYVGLEVGVLNYLDQGFISCVDTKVPSCFRDKGGPVLVDNELVGVVTEGQSECTAEMSSKYDLSKPMIHFVHTFKFKAWLDNLMTKNAGDPGTLDNYLRARNQQPDLKLTSGADVQKEPLSAFFICIFFNVVLI